MHSSKKILNEDPEFTDYLHRLFDDWCRCGGDGYWYEQIDGVKRRLVRCETHWTGDPK